MATAAGNNLGPPPIISLSSPLHCSQQQQPTLIHSSSSSSVAAAEITTTTTPMGSGTAASAAAVLGLPISGSNGNGGGTSSSTTGLRESQAPNPGDLSGIFSVVLNRQQHQQQQQQSHHHHPLSSSSSHHVRWPSFSMGNRSFWTKYCLLCTVCGSAATILAGIFLVVAALFRYYTTSIYYFETVPTYIPAILLSICGVSTIAFSCKRNRNIILLRITACWSLCSAALSSVITITTSLIHMNRLQTLKECVYTKNPPSCTCYSHSFGMQGPTGPETTHYLFENTPDCDVIHGILYSCLRAIFAISVVSVLLSIFLCMLLYQLIGHERKKAYWSRIRRINSDWSADFIACLARPMPRERSSLLPLMPSLMPGTGTIPMHPGGGGPSILPPPGWGPPPSYDDACNTDTERPTRHIGAGGQRSGLCSIQPTHSFAGTTSQGFTGGGGFFNNRSSASFAFHGAHHPPPRRLRLVTSHSENSFRGNPDGLMCPHPFSPTITTVDPASIFKQQQHLSQHHNHQHHHHHQHQQHNNHHHHHHNHHNNHRHILPSSNNCSIAGQLNEPLGIGSSPTNGASGNMNIMSHRNNFRGLSQSQVLHHSTTNEDDEDEELELDCCLDCPGNGHNLHHRSGGGGGGIPQSASFMTTASGRNSEFSITSLSMPDNSSMSITMKSSNDIPLNDSSTHNCCTLAPSNSLPEDVNDDDDDFVVIEESGGFSDQDQELSLTSNCTTSAAEAAVRHHQHRSRSMRNMRRGGGGGGGSSGDGVGNASSHQTTSSSSTGAVGLSTSGECKKPAPNTTSSEPKIINANKHSSFSSGVVLDSNNVINSDTDIILNKKALEFWGSLKKHKNFAYYGTGATGTGSSTSRRRKSSSNSGGGSGRDKSKSSLSKISSLPCSPFMNMRRKLFGGPGGKSLECFQNLNYNYSYSNSNSNSIMAPVDGVSSWMVKANNDANSNNNNANANTTTGSDEIEREKGSCSSGSDEGSDLKKKSISISSTTSTSQNPESFEVDKGSVSASEALAAAAADVVVVRPGV